MISFASFNDEGSAEFLETRGTPHVKLEDRQLHEQYEKHQTPVLFYSLKDEGCERVDMFIDKMREKIVNDNQSATPRTRTTLFLQDFPSSGS